MKIDSAKFSRETAWASGVLYAICTIFVALFPGFSSQLLGWLMHFVTIDLLGRGLQITFWSFVAGLAQVMIYMYVTAIIFAKLFNRAIK